MSPAEGARDHGLSPTRLAWEDRGRQGYHVACGSATRRLLLGRIIIKCSVSHSGLIRVWPIDNWQVNGVEPCIDRVFVMACDQCSPKWCSHPLVCICPHLITLDNIGNQFNGLLRLTLVSRASNFVMASTHHGRKDRLRPQGSRGRRTLRVPGMRGMRGNQCHCGVNVLKNQDFFILDRVLPPVNRLSRPQAARNRH